MKRSIILSMIYVLTTVIVSANVVWPALYAEAKIASIPIIAFSLIVECLFFKWLFKINYKEAIVYTFVANLLSGIAGFYVRPFFGLIWEVSFAQLIIKLFNWGTFNPVTWLFVPVIGGAINAFLELLAIRLIWKHTFTKRNYYLTWGINIVTVGLAVIWVLFDPPY